MTDDKLDVEKRDEQLAGLSRRDFVAMGVAASVAVAARPASAAAMSLVETDVVVKTPDGMCDAAFIHPATGSHPGVVIWPDAFGLRPTMRNIAKRIAAEGYTVIVPNPFYRVAKAPVFDEATIAAFSFQNPADGAKLRPLMGSISAPGAGGNRCRGSHHVPGRSAPSQ